MDKHVYVYPVIHCCVSFISDSFPTLCIYCVYIYIECLYLYWQDVEKHKTVGCYGWSMRQDKTCTCIEHRVINSCHSDDSRNFHQPESILRGIPRVVGRLAVALTHSVVNGSRRALFRTVCTCVNHSVYIVIISCDMVLARVATLPTFSAMSHYSALLSHIQP